MKTLRITVISALFAVLLAGCQHKVKYIDPAGTDGVTTVQSIDIHDWGMAAETMINSLLESGALRKKSSETPAVMVSHVRNDTGQHIDTALLTKKIRIAVNRSGKGITTTAVGVGGPEDEANMAVRDLRKSDEFNQTTVQDKGTLVAPQYSLSGKIIQLDSKAGKQRQSAFVFQMSLTDLATGLAVWEEEKTIIKQGKKAGVSW